MLTYLKYTLFTIVCVLFYGCIVSDNSSIRLKDKRPNIIILFTDDWGYADLGAYGNIDDIKTPNLDALTKQGILFTDAYITAPQCAPSRAGLLTGRYQQRFNFDSIQFGPLDNEEITIAEQLQKQGYVTGMVGKWHLEPNAACTHWAIKNHPELPIINSRVHNISYDIVKQYMPAAQGFDEYFVGELNSYRANYNLNGDNLNINGERFDQNGYRVDIQTDAGLAFIKRNAEKPFFLYLAHYAPHVPLEATQKYLSRFPGEMPERRRTALAMMSAVDDGVGKIIKLLKEKGIADNTLIMFASDNGAPLGVHQGQSMEDVLPVNKPEPAWDGSRNDPLKGEKGMLAEGGIRIPMIWSWPLKLPKGIVISEPVISLDMSASAIASANESIKLPEYLDGLNLIPWITGFESAPNRSLYWRFWNQAAIRKGKWKYYFNSEGRRMLFDLHKDKEEKNNLFYENQEMAFQFHSNMQNWTDELNPPGLSNTPLNDQEIKWFNHYYKNSQQLKNKKPVLEIGVEN